MLTLLGTAATLRECALPEATQAKLNFYRLWSLDWPWWLWIIVVLAAALIVLFEGAYRIVRTRDLELNELRDRMAAPDVRLEGFTFPGAFTLHAYGHACEIRTGPIVIESAVIATETHGDQTMQVWHPRCSIEFLVVSDLRDAAKVVEPSLFYDEGYAHRPRWPDTAPEAVMKEFFHTAKLARRGPAPDADKLSDSELEALIERNRQPFEIRFDITFWNVEHTRQWKRSEVLVYEPPPSDIAFVRHSGEPVLITRSEAAQERRAS
ncbi:MAG: hypothetical protein ACXW5U_11525 [Thermoanaerobaculia bacterium]